MKTGLTLGKFAPFHHGHALLIRAALAEVRDLYIVIYDCPDVTPIPVSVRAQWLRQWYPGTKIIEAYHAPLETGYTPELMKIHEDYIIELLRGVKIDYFFSSELYGEHMSKALGALDMRVDMERNLVKISASEIRADLWEHRKFVPNHVYRDLITNVVFVGGPSTGKTTLCKRLAEIYDTEWMPEYGRQYWEDNQVDRRLTLNQLYDIGIGHVLLENEKLLMARKYLFTDTEAITTRLFSLDYHRRVDYRLDELADESHLRYDLFFLCDTDIPFEDTPERSGDTNRQEMQAMLINELKARHIPYIVLSGPLERRLEIVQYVLSRHERYMNPYKLAAEIL